MNKNLKHTLLFILMTLAAIYGLQMVIDSVYKSKASEKFAAVMNHKIDEDIMIFGSSTTLRHFNPLIISDITGLSCYNMGTDGMLYGQNNALIQEFLTYTTRCKAIVIGCNMNMGKDEAIVLPDLFYAYLNEKNIYDALYHIDPRRIFLARYLPGYKLTLLDKPFYRNILFHPSYKNIRLRGFEPWDSETGNFSEFIEPFDEPFDAYLYDKMKTTVHDIAQKGIKVILVITPVNKDGYKLIKNAAFITQKYKDLVQDNVYCLDYTNDTLCESKKNFYTYIHLNMKGATKFSTEFAHDIQKILQK